MKESRKTSKEVWFFYQNENTASFKIDIRINKWYNFSIGKGGNTLDMVIHILNCNVFKALQFLNDDSVNLSFHKPLNDVFLKGKEYEIIKLKKIEHKALINYLSLRKINISLAQEYCFEIDYKFNSNIFFAIAFKNNSNGFEIRNKFFKGCLGKKEITLINNNYNVVSLFESWSDFLSYLTLKKNPPEENYIILNSTSMAKNVLPLLTHYSKVKIFLDNDEAGNRATKLIIKNIKNEVIDNRVHYWDCKDLNEFLIKKNTI